MAASAHSSGDLKIDNSTLKCRQTKILASIGTGISFAMPIFYECQRCSACCRWPGQVRLNDSEIRRISQFLNLSEDDFIQTHTRLTSDRRGLALNDKPTGECFFFKEGNCLIQAVKPQQCRDFPNLWNFPGFEKECGAKPRLVNNEEYIRLIEKATERTLDLGKGG